MEKVAVTEIVLEQHLLIVSSTEQDSSSLPRNAHASFV